MSLRDLVNDFIDVSSNDTIFEYSNILRDTSEIGKKMQREFNILKTELDNERIKNKLLEKELWNYRSTSSCCINRQQYIWYFKAAKEREPTESEWLDFINNFTFTYQRQLNEEVYNWIDRKN